ncbi:MAG: asparagine synthase-related protein, partial [Flavobacteriaceae bacterium]|nr:asparagine synthase-related protein [Flavobacteriaceae bacterium]
KAFDTPENPFLPTEILWRQKEQFSDGVGYSWIDQLIAFGESQVTDKQLATAHEIYPHNTPTTKEAYYYRSIFHEHFPQETAAKTVLKWIPKWQENTDPSGRANEAHSQSDTSIALKKTKLSA